MTIVRCERGHTEWRCWWNGNCLPFRIIHTAIYITAERVRDVPYKPFERSWNCANIPIKYSFMNVCAKQTEMACSIRIAFNVPLTRKCVCSVDWIRVIFRHFPLADLYALPMFWLFNLLVLRVVCAIHCVPAKSAQIRQKPIWTAENAFPLHPLFASSSTRISSHQGWCFVVPRFFFLFSRCCCCSEVPTPRCLSPETRTLLFEFDTTLPIILYHYVCTKTNFKTGEEVDNLENSAFIILYLR